MGNKVSLGDFNWRNDDEPHAKRRKEILEKHPEIKKLMVVDHSFKWTVLLMCAFQMFMCYMISFYDSPWILTFALTYIFSGTINHALLLAIHEISHNMAFGHGRPMSNKAFGILVNLPIGVPMSLSFRKYHLEHHKYQGHEILDTDIPMEIEAKLFTRTLTKAVWMFLQPLFYALRPFFVNPKVAGKLETFNFLLQFAFDALIVYTLGWKSLFYMVAGSLLGMGIHPVAGHFISEHYMFELGFETYSYYGILNKVTFNVGYHNEHHDFPNIPGKYLPKVREIAPEYYNTIPYHTSWVKVIWDYITDPKVGPYARAKRREYNYAVKKRRELSSEEVASKGVNEEIKKTE